MISPQQKIQLMRTYEINPSAAILALADMLARDVKGSVIAELRKEITDLGRLLDSIKGTPGKDADPAAVARILLASPGFVASLRGAPGTSTSPADVVRAMRADRVLMESLRGEPGRPADAGRVAEILANSPEFVSAVTPRAPEAPGAAEVAAALAADKSFVARTKGDSGSPDAPEDVARKLNETTESVKPSAVAGLRELMQKVARLGRDQKGGGKAGGGMGNTVHKSFNLTSATTSVVLDSAIAAGGYAIMGAYYEGGFVARGVGYTVGGDRKTIALLFTPEDGTHLDVVYVRS